MAHALCMIFCMTLAVVPGQAEEDPIRINNEAVALIEKGKFDQAVRKLVTAHGLDPESELIRENLAAAYAHRGIDAGEHGDFIAAVEDLRAACRHAPKSGLYGFSLASHLYQVGELHLAEAEVERSLKLSPPKEVEERLMRLKGNILYLADRLEEALAVFEAGSKAKTGAKASRVMAQKIKRELAIHREYHQVTTAYFKLIYDQKALDLSGGGSFITMLENERSRVCSDLNHFPRKRVTVVLYNPEDFKTVTESEGWVSGLFDRKIRIPLSDLKDISERTRQVIRHEYTHVIIHELAPACPAWINEGIACYEQYTRGVGEQNLRALLKTGKEILSFTAMPHSFFEISDADEVRLYYIQSHAMVEHLVEYYGMAKIRLMLRELNKIGDWRKAFRSAYSRPFEDLEKDWLQGMK